MKKMNFGYGGYLLAAALGAVAGAVVAALAMRAMPGMMAARMRRMMDSMRAEGCGPGEM